MTDEPRHPDAGPEPTPLDLPDRLDALAYDMQSHPAMRAIEDEWKLVDEAADEIRRLRSLLNQCWDAAGLLCARMTGTPDQAYEEPSELVEMIEDLASKALGRDEAEQETAELSAEVERLNARCAHIQSQWTGTLTGETRTRESCGYERARARAEGLINEAMATWDRRWRGGKADG